MGIKSYSNACAIAVALMSVSELSCAADAGFAPWNSARIADTESVAATPFKAGQAFNGFAPWMVDAQGGLVLHERAISPTAADQLVADTYTVPGFRPWASSPWASR